jgi:hypothetical protein
MILGVCMCARLMNWCWQRWDWSQEFIDISLCCKLKLAKCNPNQCHN